MRIAVFCGSSDGSDPVYKEYAYNFGKLLAGNGIGVVYGGGNVGLMGAVADGALDAGGEVIGVIPEALQAEERAHPRVTKLDVVPNMHVRKHRMAEYSDAFVALPGGPGTLEEIFEQWTWAQLGFHRKACGILNINGYYDSLVSLVDRLVSDQFCKPEHGSMLLIATEPDDLLKQIRSYKPPTPKLGAGKDHLND